LFNIIDAGVFQILTTSSLFRNERLPFWWSLIP